MKVYRSPLLPSINIQKLQNDIQGLQFDTSHYELDEVFNKEFNVIELAMAQSNVALKKMKALEWEVQMTGVCDAFVLDNDKYVPKQISAKALVSLIEFKKLRVDLSKSALLIGEYYFSTVFIFALSKLGFKKILIISVDSKDMMNTNKNKMINWQNHLFDVSISEIKAEEVSNLTDYFSLVVTDFKLSEHPTIVETISYFNFLSDQALFCDLRQFENSLLFEEAEKASVHVLTHEEYEFHKYRLYRE